MKRNNGLVEAAHGLVAHGLEEAARRCRGGGPWRLDEVGGLRTNGAYKRRRREDDEDDEADDADHTMKMTADNKHIK